jgi:hypothetical protein
VREVIRVWRRKIRRGCKRKSERRRRRREQKETRGDRREV